MSVPMREWRLPTSGGDLAICEWGAPDAPLLIFLHGWLDNAASFFTLAPALADRYRCLAIDFHGHGKADHLPAGVSYHFIDGVATLHEAFLALSEQQPLRIVGHSMGAALALLYAGAFPARVAKLISIDAFGPITREVSETAARLAEACSDRLRRGLSRKPVYSDQEMALAARAAVGDLPAELLRPIVERNLLAVEGGWTWRSDARLRLPSLWRLSPDQAASFFAAVSAPMLVIEGSRGLPMVAEALQRHAHRVARLQRVTLDGGHHVHLEQPEACVQLIRAFLAES